MNTKKRVLLFFSLLACIMLISPFTTTSVSAATKVAISSKLVSIAVGDTCTVKITGATSTVKWSVADKSVATVAKSGAKGAIATVTGIAPGTTKLTATVGKKTYQTKITVERSGIAVSMLDINQGDAFFIEVNGKNILIDTGEEKYYDKLKLQLEKKEITSIDTLIISHMDSDHMGSADKIVSEYDIKTVYIPSKTSSSNEYKEFIASLDKASITPVIVKTGDILNFGSGCTGTVLGTDMGEDTNDSSIVLKLVYYDNSFLFTGDLSAKYLNSIMNSGADITADVYKVSHHGSDYSNPVLFIKNVGAKYALVSVGANNKYGHPASTVIKRLKTYADETFRSDVDGTVTITGDGTDESLKAETIHYFDWETKTEKKADTSESSSETTPESSCGSFIGNKKTKVYHFSTCSGLPAEQNRVYFNSASEAEAAGYRACQKCHPDTIKSSQSEKSSSEKIEAAVTPELIIGNKNSKVYHSSSCQSLPIEKNRVYFNSVAEAEAAGYRACKNCH